MVGAFANQQKFLLLQTRCCPPQAVSPRHTAVTPGPAGLEACLRGCRVHTRGSKPFGSAVARLGAVTRDNTW